MQQTLTDTKIRIIPSEYLTRLIKSFKSNDFYLTESLQKIQNNEKISCDNTKTFSHTYCSQSDQNYIDQLKLNKSNINLVPKQLLNFEFAEICTLDESEQVILNVDDLKCLKDIFDQLNVNADKKIYLNDVICQCKIYLPKNHIVPRSPQLEQRCEELRNREKNREYRQMTKNVDSLRAKLPEDTISYQMREINKQLIAVFQFVMSVLAGFTFGFIGVELIVGNLDFGFRLLLGIMCGLIIALAEIYFLAKKLNEYSDFLDRNNTTKDNVNKLNATAAHRKTDTVVTQATKAHND